MRSEMIQMEKLNEEDYESLNSYCPDFSDILEDEGYGFWDFMSNGDVMKTVCLPDDKTVIYSPKYTASNNSKELSNGKRVADPDEVQEDSKSKRTVTQSQTDEDPVLRSCTVWDYLSSTEGPRKEVSNFWDFLNSPSSEEKNSFHEFQHSRRCAFEENNETTYYEDAMKTCQTGLSDSDEFWDFLKTNNATINYEEVLGEIISSTPTSLTDSHLITASTSNTIASNDGSFDHKKTICFDEVNGKSNPDSSLPCISTIFSIKPYFEQFDNNNSQAVFTWCDIGQNNMTRISNGPVGSRKIQLSQKSSETQSIFRKNCFAVNEQISKEIVTKQNSSLPYQTLGHNLANVTNKELKASSESQENCFSGSCSYSKNIRSIQCNSFPSKRVSNPVKTVQPQKVTEPIVNNCLTKNIFLLPNSNSNQPLSYSNCYIIVSDGGLMPQKASIQQITAPLSTTSLCTQNIAFDDRTKLTFTEASENRKSNDSKTIDQNSTLKMGNLKECLEIRQINNSEDSDKSQTPDNAIDKCLAGFRNNYVLNIRKRRRGLEIKQPSHLESSLEVSTTKCTLPVSSAPLDVNSLQSIIMNRSQTSKMIPSNQSSRSRPSTAIKSISLGKQKHAIKQTHTPTIVEDALKTLSSSDYVYDKILSKEATSGKETLSNQNEMQSNYEMGNIVVSNTEGALNDPKLITNLKFVNTKVVSSIKNSVSLNRHKPLFSVLPSLTFNSKSNVGSVMTVQQNVASEESKSCQSRLIPGLKPFHDGMIQRKIPTPINVIPICVISSGNPVSQSVQSEVAQGSNQNKLILPRLHSIPNQQPSDKKPASKTKKSRRKTVKELLQEHQLKLKYSTNSSGKDVRVLKPVCEIPRELQSQVLLSSSNVVNGTLGYNDAYLRKRPNIMVLPSTAKAKEEGDFSPGNKLNHDVTPDFSLDASSVDPLSPSKVFFDCGKSIRPRHYDMSELQIGSFKVQDDVDACGCFRSKFKVLFQKRQFLYDFPISRCNQPDLKTSQMWEQMARISVPFAIIASMNLKDRIILMSVTTNPQVSLGTIQARSGMFGSSAIYDTLIERDSEWGRCLRSPYHKIVLRKRQACKLKGILCEFDKLFVHLTNVVDYESQSRNNRASCSTEGELSPNSLKKSLSKNRKAFVRRLPQWDLEEKSPSEEDLLINQMCSCRTNCRSIRCSCVKAAKSCSFNSRSACQCLNCNNPLNVLETIGLDVEISLKDCCLFQNIYQIPDLLNYLQKEVKLECCKGFARVQDCIPGTVLCPNIDCNAALEYSWCQKVVCNPGRNPRNHCSFCGQCCFSSGRHCYNCKRCYAVSSKFIGCPTCQKDPDSFPSSSEEKHSSRTLHTFCFEGPKQTSKPEIIVLGSSNKDDKFNFDVRNGEPTKKTYL